MTCCPTCGQPVTEKFVFDLELGAVVAGGKTVKLSPAEAAIFGTVARQKGRPVSVSDLICALWGTVVDVIEAKSSVRVRIARINKKLDGTGLSIESDHGRGYYLKGAL